MRSTKPARCEIGRNPGAAAMSELEAPGRMADERSAVAQLKRQCERALHEAGFSRYDSKAATAIAARVFLSDSPIETEQQHGTGNTQGD